MQTVLKDAKLISEYVQEMLNFLWIVSKLIDQVYLFIKMYGVKGKLSRTYFGEMGSFFGFCNTIFCRHLQWISKKFFFSQINSGTAQFSTKCHKNNRPSVSFYKDYWYQRTTQWVKFYGIGELFFLDFVTFFLHPQGDLFSWPLYRLHHQQKSQNLQKNNLKKNNFCFFRNTLAGPVDLVNLAWKSRSKYVFEKKLFGLLYPTWTNFSEKIFSNDFLSCFEWKYCAVSQNVIFMSFIYLHFSNCKFLTFCSIDWFRFQKPLAIGPFRIPRCQDLLDKSLGWFHGF